MEYGQAAEASPQQAQDRGSRIEKAGPSTQDFGAHLHSNLENLQARLSELRNRLEMVLRPAGPTPVHDAENAKRGATASPNSPLANGILASQSLVDELHSIVNDISRRLHL